jgi:hypothetical protein
MHSYRFLFRAPLLVLFTLLIACEDPSNVGLGLVGGEGGEPVVEELALSSADAVPGTGIRDNTPQHLVGQVDDPVMGQFNATAYIDFLSNTTLDEGYRNGPIDRVFLRLQRFYVYGDTTQEMTVALHESLREFSAVGSTPDSIPAVGPEIMQFSFMPMDSIVSDQLPAAWVEAKDADLRSSSFGSLFNGFQLVPISGNAIVGFRNSPASQSTIRGYVETDDETFQEDYLAAKSITQFTRERSAEAPPGIMIIQNGVGPRLRLNFDLSQLQDVSLNRTVLHFATDSLALAASPNFVRTFQDNRGQFAARVRSQRR